MNSRVAYSFIAGLPLLLLSCQTALPNFRITVQTVPAGTTQLEIAAYVNNVMAMQTPTVAVTGPSSSLTVGLSLGGTLSGDKTAISVAARRADGCLLAVGTSATTALPSDTGTDVTVALSTPSPAVSDTVCLSQPPVILAALRSQQGPLNNMTYSVFVQGWGFPADAQVTVKSTGQVLCSSSGCTQACNDSCTGMMGCSMNNGSSCMTNCTVQTDVLHTGPALIQLNLEPSNNNLQQQSTDMGTGTTQLPDMGTSAGSCNYIQPVDLLQLISQPLKITLTSADGNTTLATFTETPVFPSMTKTTM
jgi:hypothetical protein